MKKILCINVSDQGSTGKIMKDIAKESRNYSFIACVPRITSKENMLRTYALMFIPHEQGVYRRITEILGYPYGFAPISTFRLKHIIKREKPDLVHMHCVNSNTANIYTLFQFLSKRKIPVVITNHAEFYYTGSCAYAKDCLQWLDGCKKCPNLYEATGTLIDRTAKAWKKMKKGLESVGQITVVSVSPWVLHRCSMSGIMKNIPQELILNGIDTEIFYPQKNTDLHNQFQNKRIVLHVTASFTNKKEDIKGGHYIISLAKKWQTSDDILFVVAGKVGQDINVNKLPDNIVLLGNVSEQSELAKWYSAAAVTIITSKRETFSMPVAESLCCGTPIVGFKAGGPESIALKEFSEFVPYGDQAGLERILKKWITVKELDVNIEYKCASCAQKKFGSKYMAQKYEELYHKMIP